MNKKYFWPAAFYFLSFAALASIVPFLTIYYRSLGFSGGQIGLILGLSPLITLFATPLLTGMADAFQKHKLMLLVNLALLVGLMSIFPFLKTFGAILAAFLVFSFINAPIYALVDSATLAMLGDERNKYGQIRLWGTIGWGLMGTVAGLVMEQVDLQWIFWLYGGLTAVNLLVANRIQFTRVTSQSSFWKNMHSLVSNPRWIVFLLLALITAFGYTAHQNFLGVLMENQGASRTAIGFALSVTTISEIPLLLFSAYLLKRMKAPVLLVIAVLAGSLRVFAYSLSPSPEILLAIQLFHGLTYPLFWIAGVTYTAENAPPGLSATAQGLFGAALMGLGSGGANLLCGLLIDLFGISGMFFAIGTGVVVALGVLLLLGGKTLFSR